MKHLTLKYPLLTAAVLGLGLSAALSPARALADDSESLRQQVQDLDQKIRVLQRKLENADEDAATAKASTAVVAAGDKGFGLKSADGNFEVKLKGLVQSDVRDFRQGIKGQYPAATTALPSPDSAVVEAPDDLLIRRARPTIEGTVFGTYGFRITPDFAGSTTSLVDAYIDGNYNSAFKLRAGKFTPPLGVERLQSSADTKFNELSLASDFIPSRDTGVQIGGALFSGTVNYAVGIFNGALDGATGANSDTNADKEIQYRIFTQPLINHPGLFQGLGLGVAFSKVNQQGGSATPVDSTQPALTTELPTYNSIGQQTIFSYRKDGNIKTASNPATSSKWDTVYANGDRTRLIPQAHYFLNNVGVIAEYVREKQDVERDVGTTGSAIPNTFVGTGSLYHKAKQITFAWAITGEDESLAGIKPAADFDPAKGTWGAWELVVRSSQIAFDRDSFTVGGVLANNTNNFADPTASVRTAHDIGVGVNWYANKNTRISLDYDRTSFDWGGGGTLTAPEDRPDENVIIARVQASF